MDEAGRGAMPTVADAVMRRAAARRGRALANAIAPRDPTGARFERGEAAEAERAALARLTPARPIERGRGGEFVPSREAAAALPGIAGTVADPPDLLAADASLERLRLAGDANVLTLGLDLAETEAPRAGIETLLTHQLAAAHRLAMAFAGRAFTHAQNSEYAHNQGRGYVTNAEDAVRFAALSARLMGAFQTGALALARLRGGGEQTVRVVHQHVAVASGGAAVVGGVVRGGGGEAGERTEK